MRGNGRRAAAVVAFGWIGDGGMGRYWFVGGDDGYWVFTSHEEMLVSLLLISL